MQGCNIVIGVHAVAIALVPHCLALCRIVVYCATLVASVYLFQRFIVIESMSEIVAMPPASLLLKDKSFNLLSADDHKNKNGTCRSARGWTLSGEVDGRRILRKQENNSYASFSSFKSSSENDREIPASRGTENYEGLPLERVRTDSKGDTHVPFTSVQAGPSSILSSTSSNSSDSLVSNSAEGVQVPCLRGGSSGSCEVKPTEKIQATGSEFSDGNAEHDKGTVRRGEVDPDSSSKTGNQLLLQRNSNEHDQRKEERLEPGSDSSPSIGNQSQLTEGSCKPDAASNFYRKWEPQGARPKLTQLPVDPPLWPSASPVSEGLAQDSLPGQTDVSWVRNGMSSDEVNTSNRLLPPDDFGTSDHSLAGEQDFGNTVKANDNPLAALSEKGEGKRGEQGANKWQEAGPSQQKDVSTGSQRLCEHYVRRCRVCFSCCEEFYPCHKCHNKSTKCENGQAKAGEATHLKCSLCQFEQAVSFWFSSLRVHVTEVAS